jgi:TolB-like protein
VPPAAGAAQSVAVLPFQRRGAVTGHDHLSLALPDEIATLLTYAPGLAVRSFTDSSRYTGRPLDLARVGRELGAQRLVIGNFGSEGTMLRFSVEAIELTGNRVLWRDTWTVAPTQLASLRDVVRERVGRGLLPALGQTAELLAGAKRGPASDQSYELYLRASGLTTNSAPNQEAIGLLERATALDPGFAPAWLELARRLSYESVFGGGAAAGQQRAAEAAARATALDPDLLPAAVFKITNIDAYQGRVVEAYRAAEELVKRRPESAKAHHARGCALRYGGAVAEAARECRLARTLDPTDPLLWSCYWTFLHLGDVEQAQSFAELSRERQPDLIAMVLGDIWTRKGDRAAALEALTGVPDAITGVDLQRACLQDPRPEGTADLVKRDLARIETIVGGDPEGRYWFAALTADCGFEAAAFRFLESSIDGGYCSFAALDNDPLWNRVRQRPEFGRLRERARRCRDRFLAESGVSD